MKSGAALALMGILLLAGCRTAHDVADSSYQAATAPVNAVRHQPTETATTTTPPQAGITSSQPVQPPPASTSEPPPPLVSDRRPASEEQKPRTASSPRPSSTLEFPTAKPVEGKPGYVYSPFDPDKYVDVSGYAPGSKVKDPVLGKDFSGPVRNARVKAKSTNNPVALTCFV